MLDAIRQITARAARPRAADWICRRAVHARVLCDRRRTLEQLRPHQGADVRRARRVAPASATCCPTSPPTISIAQIEAGVQAVQVFDSWVGALNADDYREFILPHTQQDLRSARGLRRADHSLRRRHQRDSRRAARGRRRRHRRRLAPPARRSVGADRVRSGDSGQSRSDGAARAASRGFSPRPTKCSIARDGPGHIFNLGHGILPMTRSSTSRRSRGTSISRPSDDERRVSASTSTTEVTEASGKS